MVKDVEKRKRVEQSQVRTGVCFSKVTGRSSSGVDLEFQIEAVLRRVLLSILAVTYAQQH